MTRMIRTGSRTSALGVVTVVTGLAVGRAWPQPPAPAAPAPPPVISAAGAAVEQTAPGTRPSAELIASFDGLGVGFEGPQGTFTGRSPSDSSLAAGPDHVVQIVNSGLPIYKKKA